MPISELFSRIGSTKRAPSEDDRQIREALQAWKDATRFFECADGSDLIDFAVYDMEAARRKYMFLLRQKGRSQKTGGQQ